MAATIRASTAGLDLVDKARRKKGWKKTEKAWAGLVPTSIATLRRFWAGLAIQSETFQKICEAVDISDWEAIGDFENIDRLPLKAYEKRLSFAIAGSIDGTDKRKLDAIVALLRKLGGDAEIEILDIDEGSIKLILGGSPKSLKRIEALFKSGTLTEISEISVEDVHFVDRNELAQLIRKNGGTLVNLIGADLIGADLRVVYLIGADLRVAYLSRADLRVADLRGADLRGTDLIGADLREADLRGADLRIAYLRGAYLRIADLRGADLRGADLRGADLSAADLRGADLRGANLIGVELKGADLSGADLSGADLSGADLSGADLSGANLSEADLSRTLFADNLGLAESDKRNMQARGAIFQDSPESDVPSLVRR